MEENPIDEASAELAGWPNPLARLRVALENNEFTLYCQPIASLRARTDADRFPLAEVLVRMREEERALLPPGEFLPVFEHFGMMPQLDRWVVRHAVQQLARGSRIERLTINVSGQTLKDPTFPPFAAAELRAAGIAIEAVMFEIDESDLLARPEPSATFAAAVRAYGGAVLIDGFCRRAVSFAPFKALRPALVKVDGSVIRKLLTSEAALTKLKAVVRVAAELGIGVVAECVEHPEVLDRLKALEVGYAQGFGVQQPQPIARVLAKA